MQSITLTRRSSRRPALARTRGKGRQSNQDEKLPPQIDLDFRIQKRIRYTVVATGNTWPVYREDLLNLFYMGTGTNSARRILGSVKLNRIEIWAQGAYPTTQTTVLVSSPDVKWLGVGPQTKKSISGFSGVVTHLVTSPPADSLAAFWCQTGITESDMLLELTMGQGNIIDLWVDCVIQNDDPSIAAALVTSATATAGIVYYNNLGGAVATIQPQVGNPNYAT